MLFPLISLSAVLAYLAIRQTLWLVWRRSRCPRCRHDIAHTGRRTTDYLLTKLLLMPVRHYQCAHFRCNWHGRSHLFLPNRNYGLTKLIRRPISQGLTASEPVVSLEAHRKASDLLYRPLDQIVFNAIEHSGRALEIKTDDSNLAASNALELQGHWSDENWSAWSEKPATRTVKSNLSTPLLSKYDFKLNYHPRVDIFSHDILGVEALLRWNHPANGFIHAQDFIGHMAGDVNFLSIANWTLTNAFKQLSDWHNLGLKSLRLSINLSVEQFYGVDLIADLNERCSFVGLDPRFIEVEVTEKTIFQNADTAQKILTNLKALGIQVAVDDFGLGEKTLKEFFNFPINTIKIDQRLIGKLSCRHSEEFLLIQALIWMAQDQNLNVVAEGVENNTQLNLLRMLGCQSVQGYLFDLPLSAEDATDVLQANWLGRKSSKV
jgi:EAL domain-containing protein (putative c-di-GMP-specific phosphodiesterase class I)